MSDRVPKVEVYLGADGRWAAICREPNCPWAHTPHPKGYVEQRARAHRAEHRTAAECG